VNDWTKGENSGSLLLQYEILNQVTLQRTVLKLAEEDDRNIRAGT